METAPLPPASQVADPMQYYGRANERILVKLSTGGDKERNQNKRNVVSTGDEQERNQNQRNVVLRLKGLQCTRVYELSKPNLYRINNRQNFSPGWYFNLFMPTRYSNLEWQGSTQRKCNVRATPWRTSLLIKVNLHSMSVLQWSIQ